MSPLLTVADFQDLARQITMVLPAAIPLTATLETTHPDPTALEPEFTVATLQHVGAQDISLLLAVTAQVLEPLDQSGLDLGSGTALPVLLESVAQSQLSGSIVNRAVAHSKFASASTVYFSLRSGPTLAGWLALNIQEVTPVFDQDPAATGPHEPQPFVAPPAQAKPADQKSLRLLYDVEMTLTAEIGRAKLPVRQILDLAPGAIVELDRLAGSAADLMVNGHLVARGEVVVIDEDYGLRITEIMDATEGLV